MITADNIRQALRCGEPGCKCGKSKEDVHCPAHTSDKANFSVSEKNGKILVKCHVGCTQDQVVDALKARNLWPSKNSDRPPKFNIVKTYDYHDAAGKMVFQVCRLDPKDFRQRRPDGKGGWVWNMKGVKLVPYRLPKVLKVGTVFVGEGEQDCDNMAALGLTATCNPGGARKWRKEYNQYFRGKAVVIFPDVDDPGRAHALDVARHLHGVAASIKVVELPGLPEKGDISDWLKAGGTLGNLQALVDAAPEFDPATAPSPGAETPATSKSKEDEDEEPKQGEILLKIARAAELFHTPDDESFARIPVNGHLETWAIKGGGFKKWLLHEFYKRQGKAPQSEIFSSTIKLLDAKALFEGPLRPVWVRVAEDEGATYLDLRNEAWEAVKVTSDGWEVLADPPVCFRRPRSMLPLPYPERGGNINELRPFVNVVTVQDFRLVVAYQLAAMRARGPYPIMVVNGEQGSAKSTMARVNRSLVDPNTSPLRSAPREERDLMISAINSWMLVFDNLSGMPPWLSDSFCRLSTGGGISNRELYTNGEEFIMDAMRPVLLNGIDALTERSDLAGRSLIFNLPQIPEDARRPEKEFWADFEQARPRILGALLDAVSRGLRNQHSVRLSSLPRMADFAIWVTACEPALPWPPGSFMEAYLENRAEAVELSLEADCVAVAVRAHMANKEEWSGTPSELYQVLKTHVAEDTQKSKVWPKAAQVLTSRLKRAATFLRAVGLKIDFGKSGNRKTTITRKSAENSVQSVQSAQSAQAQENQGISPDASKNSSVQPGVSRVQEDNGGEKMDASFEASDAPQKKASTRKATDDKGMDDVDDVDDAIPSFSKDEDELLSGKEVEL